MPIIAIEALVDEEPDLATMLHNVAERAADALGIEPRYCWVTFRYLASGSYLEGGRIREASEANEVSPIVRVSAYRGLSAAAKRDLLVALAEAVGRGLRVPAAAVYVELHEIPEGHVYAGGRVL